MEITLLNSFIHSHASAILRYLNYINCGLKNESFELLKPHGRTKHLTMFDYIRTSLKSGMATMALPHLQFEFVLKH